MFLHSGSGNVDVACKCMHTVAACGGGVVLLAMQRCWLSYLFIQTYVHTLACVGETEKRHGVQPLLLYVHVQESCMTSFACVITFILVALLWHGVLE